MKPLRCVALGALLIAALSSPAAFGGDCSDPQGACPTPCPAERSCNSPYGSGEGCPERLICVPSCLPSWCVCDVEHNSWACSADCGGECYDWPEPTGPPTHTITSLGTLGGLEGVAKAINNYGDIVGEAGAPDGRRHATLWTNGQAIDIGPPNRSSWGVAINNSGQALVADNYHVWLWEKGSGLDLLSELIRAYAINDAGQVVGISSAGLGSVLWQDGTIVDLWETIGIGGTDINNLGQIAGSIPAGSYSSHAAFWDGSQVIDLGTLGGLYSFATGVNDLGQVIGESERAPGGDRIFYGFLWDRGRLTDLSELVGYKVRGLHLNNCGEVLLPGTGRSDEAFYVYHAERGLRPVRGVYGPEAGWWYFYGRGMNDAGEIVGSGSMTGPGLGFLIAPVRGDLDWDGDVDLGDFADFSARLTGPKAPAIPGCERADIDRDADVDLWDFALFQEVLRGPQ